MAPGGPWRKCRADGAGAIVTAPYVIASCAVSLDGCLDDGSRRRLILSHAEDLARVDGLRASCDAILVGASTIRSDDPRLLVKSQALVRARVEQGRPEQPAKVTITASGRLDSSLAFFTTGPAERIVYSAGDAAALGRAIGEVATVVALPRPASPRWLLEDLGRRGIHRVLVEGGAQVLTWFLAEDQVDELHVAIAPFLLADAAAVRIVGAARLPFGPERRMPLRSVEQVGDMVVAVYQLKPRR